MHKPEVLITGASGEIGQSLLKALAEEGRYDLVALDLKEPPPELVSKCKVFYRGNIMDRVLTSEIDVKHRFEQIFHLAGLLSTMGEKNPKLAHEVNVEGSLRILDIAQRHSNQMGKPVVMLFSSSIAVYGLEKEDDRNLPVTERQYLTPTTMYGINKLYIEQLGRYYSECYRCTEGSRRLDFRCLRFPGLISPETLPAGGTSDYGPEMLHAAARNLPYACFVAPETRLPFMVMPDAVKALVSLSRAPGERLQNRIYNVTSFSVTAAEIREMVLKFFPNAELSFKVDPMRQAIVQTWPERVDDEPARRDWDWLPDYGFENAFSSLLIPKIKDRYGI